MPSFADPERFSVLPKVHQDLGKVVRNRDLVRRELVVAPGHPISPFGSIALAASQSPFP